MKITAITTATYRWPRHKPITNGKHTYTHAGVGLVQIETDAGVTGIGLGDVGGIAKAAIDYFTPLLIGADPLDVERLWHKMWVPMWGKIYQHTLRLNDDGTVSPPDAPGVGIDPQYETLAPYRVG